MEDWSESKLCDVVNLFLGTILFFSLTGLWLIVVPWLLGFEESNAVMVDVMIGIVVALWATFEIWLALDRRGPTGGSMAAQG